LHTKENQSGIFVLQWYTSTMVCKSILYFWHSSKFLNNTKCLFNSKRQSD
jgi:hypothetical protein